MDWQNQQSLWSNITLSIQFQHKWILNTCLITSLEDVDNIICDVELDVQLGKYKDPIISNDEYELRQSGTVYKRPFFKWYKIKPSSVSTMTMVVSKS